MTAPPTYLFAGGGSGGHLYPGLAVAEALRARRPDCRIAFAGSDREVERTIFTGTGFVHHPLPVLPPAAARRHPLRFLAGLWRGGRAAGRLLEELRPDAVIGLGGFASVPVGVAAARRGVPLVLLEQNVIPGRANTTLARHAASVCISFVETAALLPRGVSAHVTGNPLRRSVLEATTPRRGPSEPPTLLILGGSQGAAGVNRMALAAAANLRARLRNWRLIHQTGERDAAAVRAGYAAIGLHAEVAPFFEDLPTRYARATLTVSRAGATTLAELAACGLPAVLIPYPRSARDHQQRNADHHATAGAAVVVPEGRGDADQLTAVLSVLTATPRRLADMATAMRGVSRPDAADRVVEQITGSQPVAKAA